MIPARQAKKAEKKSIKESDRRARSTNSPEIVSAGPQIGSSSSSSSKLSFCAKKLCFGLCSGTCGFSAIFSIFSGGDGTRGAVVGGGAACGFNGRLKSLDAIIDFRGGIGGASWSFGILVTLKGGLSLDERSIKGALLMLVMDELDDEEDDDEVLPDEDVFVIGGGFEDLLLELELIGFAEQLPVSLSCDDDVSGVLRTSFGDVCGLWTFSPRVNVKLLLNACIDDSAKLKSLS